MTRLTTRLLLLAILATLLVIAWRLLEPPRPSPRLIELAVRATLYAQPTATPQRIIVTQVVTQVVVVTATPTPAPATAQATPTPTVTALPTPVTPTAAPPVEAASDPIPPEVADVAEAVTEVTEVAEVAEVAVAAPGDATCPATSPNQYATIPVAGGGLEHPAEQHADLNLTLRGYLPTTAATAFVTANGPVDSDPPQLAGLLADGQAPVIVATHQVYGWDWQCAPHGCRTAPLTAPEVTLVALQTPPGAAVYPPRRGQQIYADGYTALVLYAEATQLTLGFTREDSVAGGYVVHLANLCVDPALLALYTASHSAGRGALPAVRAEQPVGMAALGDLLVAVRDRGTFLDPRSRLDWWRGQ